MAGWMVLWCVVQDIIQEQQDVWKISCNQSTFSFGNSRGKETCLFKCRPSVILLTNNIEHSHHFDFYTKLSKKTIEKRPNLPYAWQAALSVGKVQPWPPPGC